MLIDTLRAMHRPTQCIIGALVFILAASASAGPSDDRIGMLKAGDEARPELAYLKQVNDWGIPANPQLVLLLMAQFMNAGRHEEGIEFFSRLMVKHGPTMTPSSRALFLCALASLRAEQTSNIFLLSRIRWVRDTLAMLDEAKTATSNAEFIPRWMSGVIRARLPVFFGEGKQAEADLQWCLEHAELAPHLGWTRELYGSLSDQHTANGDGFSATRLAKAVGVGEGRASVVLTTPYSENLKDGHMFSPRSITPVVPGRVFAISGYDFADLYFIISADREELIAIDAGTRDDSVEQALSALKSAVPGLPPLTTVMVTHAHWDHVGGHQYLRRLPSNPKFIGHADYQSELVRDARATPAILARFFGSNFRLESVLDYHPDVVIHRQTSIAVGGTEFELIPTRGGETNDALLISMPAEGIVFVGDAFMPYFGAPFVEEGSIDGMLSTIEQLQSAGVSRLLHGHEPLTRIFSTTRMLSELREPLAWLRDSVVTAIRNGEPRGRIHAANLVPPTLRKAGADVHLAYLVLRENVINRLFDQHSGYWQADLTGLDSLQREDRADGLVNYLQISAQQAAEAAGNMIRDGKHELALDLIQLARSRYPADSRLIAMHRAACLKLMEKYQEFSPFKFIVYSGLAGIVTPQMSAPSADGGHSRGNAPQAAAIRSHESMVLK